MKRSKLSSAMAVAWLAFSLANCAFAQGTIQWKLLKPNLWLALNQTWGPVRFSALKFHLGYYKLSLLDVRSYRDDHLEQIRAMSDNRRFSNQLLDVGVGVIFSTGAGSGAPLTAIAPAGWSTSLRKIEHSGLLRISGKELSEFDDRESLSAILCLHSPLAPFALYEYQVPVFFRTSEPKQVELAETCVDAVQVGPRIIEDLVSSDRRGIESTETNLKPQVRMVFAVDDPGRSFPPDKPNNKIRENARNGYLLITENPVHLWDIQEMLLSKDFYPAGTKPHWAINMAGGGPAGMVVRTETGDPLKFGNQSGLLGSVLLVTTREIRPGQARDASGQH